MSRTLNLKWLAAPVALIATMSLAAPRASTPADLHSVALSRLNLSGTPASLPAALSPLADGTAPTQSSVARASAASSVTGSSAGITRFSVPVDDVNGDAVRDILDIRAMGGTLTYQVISGKTGSNVWRADPIVRAGEISASVFPATLNDGPADFYLLESSDSAGQLSWTLHAIDGANGTQIWAQSGSMPTGAPSVPATPQVPPTLPPVGAPPIPGSLPTLPGVPPLPSPSVPAVPTLPPVGVPAPVPTCLPAGSGLPAPVPTCAPAAPGGAPTLPPVGVPAPVPTCLPAGTGLPAPVPTCAPAAPGGAPTIPGGTLPSPGNLPPRPSGAPSVGVPSIPPLPVSVPSIHVTIPPSLAPGVQGRRSAPTAASSTPFAAYVTGAKSVDVDGDGAGDFPLTQTLALTTQDGSSAVISMLTVVSGKTGMLIGSAVATGRGAVPSVGIAGDFTGTGKAGLFAVDEIAGPSGSYVAYRAMTQQGAPVFAGVEQAPPGLISVYDAASDLTGDGRADVLVSRFPILTGTQSSHVSVRTGPTGLEAWHRTFEETALAYVSPDIDGQPGGDVVTQGLKISAPGTIPSDVVYRGLGGLLGNDVYGRNVKIINGGAIGDWYATLSSNAGKLDGDSIPDLVHSVNGVPSNGAATLWSQAGVSGKTGQALWMREGPLTPGQPIRANVVGNSSSDLIDVQESTTKLSDSIVIKTSSGADGLQSYSSRVLIGGGTERVRSVVTQPLDAQAVSSDIIMTVVQRSGTGSRSLVIAIRGATGQVLWIRTA